MPLAASDHALIFDMDGVLVNNTAFQAEAFRLLFRELGLETDALNLLKRLNGMPATNILKTVYRHPVPEKELKQYADRREFLYRVLYWDKRQETPGLTQFLQAARTAGFKIGLGTGSPPETISYIIDHLNLRRYFDVVVGKADVARGKPHADTFAVTARQLGIPPERCVVFEDAILGEQSAYKAGMRVVAVASALEPEQFQAPMQVINDFHDFTPERVLELLEQHPRIPKPSKALSQRNYSRL